MEANSLFDDLVLLEQNSFQKKRETCSKIYVSVDDFTAKTVHIDGRSGLKSSEGDEGETFWSCLETAPVDLRY